MIEKLDIIKHTENVVDRDGYTANVVHGGVINKINEIIEIVNTLVEENNIHEEEIDELQMKLEPEKCESTKKMSPEEFAELELLANATFK